MSPSERPVVFYAEDAFTYVQFRGYIEHLLSGHSLPVRYLTSDPDDPLFGTAPTGMTVHYIDRQLPRLMTRLTSGLVIMTMPDLGAFHVPVPGGARTLYLFHSLNSAHTSYRSGAFDAYDHFGATGPHHIAELGALRAQRGRPLAQLHEVGYHKLDRIAVEYERFQRSPSGVKSILLAPSWAPQNLLEAHGEELVGTLVGRGFEVVVRPHPQFFHSLYPAGRGVVDQLMSKFADDPRVRFELTITDQDSFYSCDLMVSDWSGAAFEYALGTLRPALFIDTPQKIFNDEWLSVGLPVFEADMRSEVGTLLARDRIASAGSVVESMIRDETAMRERLAKLRTDLIFNPGTSAEAGASLIARLVE
jgi:YidC/Oxa1 family membrane protein insertase